MSTRLFIRTKSIPTAAAIWLLTGTEPEVLKRANGDVTFQFPSEAEAALDKFVGRKDAIDKMVADARTI